MEKHHPLESGQLDLIEVLEILNKLWKKALIVGLSLGVLKAGHILFFTKSIYSSSAVILSTNQNNASGPLNLTQVLLQARSGGSNQDMLQYEKILQTAELKSRVVKRLGRSFPGKLVIRQDGPTMIVQITQNTPEFAQQVVQAHLDELEDFLREIYIKRAEANKSFFEARLKDADLAMITLEKQMNQLRVTEAQREYQTQVRVSSLLREQYEMAQIEAKKQQTNFLVIDPPKRVPINVGPSPIRMSIITFLIVFMGYLAVGLVLILIRREIDDRKIARAAWPGIPAITPAPSTASATPVEPQQPEKPNWMN